MKYLVYKDCKIKLDEAISRVCEFCNKKSDVTNYRLSIKSLKKKKKKKKTS